MSMNLMGHHGGRGPWVTIGVALAMVGGFVVAFYVPNARKMKSAEATLAECQAELSMKLARSKDLPVLLDEVRTMEAGYERDVARIPSEPRIPEFLESVAAVMKEAGIVQRNVLPQAPRMRPSYVEQPMSIAFEAPYEAAYEVLRRIEGMDRITRVESLELVATPSDNGTVRVKMSVVVFCGGREAGSHGATQLATSGGGRG
ncbi:MAG TPA: type 4a pilus biogenesis protein PilO [Phycisphaerae bacterium]|nr:type 4a pilus biogenesis protein PilO [Phycisphaerae bacterium]